MQPQNPYVPSPPSPEQNPYDFIMNNGQQSPKKPFSLPGGGSKMQRILFAAVGGVILLMLVIMGISLLSAGGKEVNDKLLAIAQQQTEIIRVANLAKNETRGSEAQNLSANTSISIQSSLNDVTALLASANIKANDKILGAGINSKTDATLQTAGLNNRYDEIYIEITKAELNTYRNNLQETYKATSNKAQKEVLDSAYKSASLLIGE